MDSQVALKLTVSVLGGRENVFSVAKDKFTIGRSNKCDVVIPHESLSREHCLIEVIDGDVFVTDIGSANGVLINGERIPPSRPTLYNLSLTLTLGGVEIYGLHFVQEEDFLEAPFEPSSGVSSNTITKISNKTKAKSADIVEPKPGMHPGVRGLLIIMAVIFLFLGYRMIIGPSESESDYISRMLFEKSLNSKSADGSIKTRNF